MLLPQTKVDACKNKLLLSAKNQGSGTEYRETSLRKIVLKRNLGMKDVIYRKELLLNAQVLVHV